MERWREWNLVRRPRAFNVAHAFTKVAAIGFGFAATVICLMAVIGDFTPSLPARIAGAVVLAIGVPAIVVALLRPKEDPLIAVGLASETYALLLLGFAVVFVVVAHARTAPLLVREGDREASEIGPSIARAAWLLGGRR